MRPRRRPVDPSERAHPNTDLRVVYFVPERRDRRVLRVMRMREEDRPGPGVTSEQFAAAAYRLAHRGYAPDYGYRE